MLKVYEVPGAWGVPSVSPFCLKLTTWLRMAAIPHESVQSLTPFGAPKGKVPYIETAGAKMGDSGFIVDHLTREHGVQLDAHLSADQRARAHALRRMLEEGTYYVLLWGRWADDAGWAATKPAIFGAMPTPVRLLVPPIARRKVRGYLHGQGTGRHTPAEIARLGHADVQALADALGDQAYFFGEPSSFDATAYAFLANFLWAPHPAFLQEATRRHPNLVAFCERMQARYWAS